MGPIRLLPFRRGTQPGDLPHVQQADIDAIVGTYAAIPGCRVTHAALLEVDNWQVGANPEPYLARLRLARDAIGFSALAARQLFRGHSRYCCFDDFTLVIRGFQPGNAEHFSYAVWRRDGNSLHGWGASDFAFHQPLHVGNLKFGVEIDDQLVRYLMGSSANPRVIEAIAEFNRANTDSDDMPTHVELVMMKSAFEQLLDVGVQWQDFAKALESILKSIPAPTEIANGQVWLSRYSKSKRPISAWAQEFCARRSAAAHGNRIVDARHVWSERAHLAFAAMLFPLLVKYVASAAGAYRMTSEDTARLSGVELYLDHHPFAALSEDREDEDDEHPWSRIDSDLHSRILNARIREQLMARFNLDYSIDEDDGTTG